MGGEDILAAALQAMQKKTFYHAYWKKFDVIEAHNDLLREKAFRLRYRIFCEENSYIVPDSAEELERDAYDRRATHFLLLHRDSGEAIGTVRVIPPNEAYPESSFPLQEMCDHPLLMIDRKIVGLCEISRLCMVREFRRRPMDGKVLPAYYEPESIGDGMENLKALGRYFQRRIPYAPLGLLKAAFEATMANGTTDAVSSMDPTQFRTLKRIGLCYRVLGPRLDVHGGQQPVVFNIKNVLDNMAMENPECWEVVSDRGRLHQRANTLAQNEWHDGIFDETCRDLILRKLL